MKKCLITGINGFAGSFLASALLKEGFKVSGTYLAEDLSMLSEHSKDITLRRADITDHEAISAAISMERPDTVYHLAAIASVAYSFKEPAKTMAVNVDGTRNVLEACAKAGTKNFIFIGSADEYGIIRPQDLPIKESHPLNPVSPYATSKKAGEELVRDFSASHGIRSVITRSFNHTGPGQAPDFVASDWARQIAAIEKGKGEPLLKVGNLDVKRDFLDVRDVIQAYILLAARGEAGQAYNICSGTPYELKEILGILTGLCTVPIRIEKDPGKFRPSDNPVYVGDNSKISALGWKPRISMKKTLGDLLDYWRSRA